MVKALQYLYLSSIIGYLYILGISSVLLAYYCSPLNGLLKYGKTLVGSDKPSNNKSWFQYFESIYIPKSTFCHFYVISLVLSTISLLFTITTSVEDWNFLSWITPFLVSPTIEPISYNQLEIIMLMNIIQALRRCYECYCISNFSPKSKIHISHYFAGLFFYTAINIQPVLLYLPNKGTDHEMTKLGGAFLISALLFLTASVDQFMNHKHLSQLKKYTQPSYGLFKYVSCPHYFDEIVIYFAHLIILRNWYGILEFIWVVCNLCVSADGTYRYYTSEKQGVVAKDNMARYYRIIPFVY
ncbi:hypothetical protein CANARDRAFT_93486 [[Candida] arabinofermentans NRRL YB-2248]|uniref:Polyprenal reductase n=1 Tax=[Candida] arabinofermentans NRRL YB-2248 TaxID=983967 RepID=A0A1E4T6H4_9ASCO|nr:hypothetical protein CANARDRAFT_93486 [[Candida] arabinofermentans NRRL YB-2248]